MKRRIRPSVSWLVVLQFSALLVGTNCTSTPSDPKQGHDGGLPGLPPGPAGDAGASGAAGAPGVDGPHATTPGFDAAMGDKAAPPSFDAPVDKPTPLEVADAAPPAPAPGGHWDDGFTQAGISHPTRAIALVGDDLFVAYGFPSGAGPLRTPFARWNRKTRTWHNHARNLRDGVQLLAAVGRSIYASGEFGITAADGEPAKAHLMRFDIDKQAWTVVAGAPNTAPRAFAVHGTTLYVGGDGFRQVGDQPADCMAKLETTTGTWAPMDNGLACEGDAGIHELATDGTSLYAGGLFAPAPDLSIRQLARWDSGTAKWVYIAPAPSDGFTPVLAGTIDALAVYQGALYVGSKFTTTGYPALLARWRDGEWTRVEPKVFCEQTDTEDCSTFLHRGISSLVVSAGELFVVGKFNSIGTSSVNYVARYDGLDWDTFLGGTNGAVWGLATDGQDFFVTGDFNRAGLTRALHVAQWNGSGWHALDAPGVGGPVLEFARVPGTSIAVPTPHLDTGEVRAQVAAGPYVYVGGEFDVIGPIEARNVARFDGKGWSALGDGLEGTVVALAVIGDKVYAAGSFRRGERQHYPLAEFDGRFWRFPIFDNHATRIFALAVRGRTLYVGGSFDEFAGKPAQNVAAWDTDTDRFYALGEGPVGPPNFGSQVDAMLIRNDDLYVGGSFRQAGGRPAHSLARWSFATQEWSTLGPAEAPGVNGTIATMAADGDTALVVGGAFTTAGTEPAGNVARWDGTRWDTLAGGFEDQVWAIAVSPDHRIYAGGLLERNIRTFHGIAAFDGTRWSALGAGLNNQPYTMLYHDGALLVGGFFTAAGDRPSYHFARWFP
jgi:trimeric autotransporter adhesin